VVFAVGQNVPVGVGFGTKLPGCTENSKKRNITGEVRRNVFVDQMVGTFVMIHFELPPVR
jgi:hypothetical protein